MNEPPIPVEIERKFLLTGLPDLEGLGAERLEIEQGWIPGDRLRERIRHTHRAGGDRYHRAIKFGKGIRRIEIEEETTRAIFDALWPLTEGQRIRKLRFRIYYGDLLWEVDQFLDHDLVLAEVELPHEDTAVPIPPWMAALVVREVTDEAAYVNYNLAR